MRSAIVLAFLLALCLEAESASGAAADGRTAPASWSPPRPPKVLAADSIVAAGNPLWHQLVDEKLARQAAEQTRRRPTLTENNKGETEVQAVLSTLHSFSVARSIQTLYAIHKPSQDVGQLLAKYKGVEIELLDAIRTKYERCQPSYRAATECIAYLTKQQEQQQQEQRLLQRLLQQRQRGWRQSARDWYE
eukprot:COSAG06_NODE_22598_length_718_cov_1.371567_1_plen_190_part_01